MIGKSIAHYQNLEKIGEGGMGVIYKAFNTKLKKYDALKFLPHSLTHDSEEKQRFIQEAIAASALQHANIITVYDIMEVDGETFISMEYVEGGNLRATLGKGQVPVEIFYDIAIGVCEGLYRAHQKGIIHRDIKTENILLTADGIPKVSDFGLAKLKGSGTITLAGKALGTAAYMSPEQVQGEEIDARSDIFSLGVVFYELLTGQLPFKGAYAMAIMYSIVNDEPLSPSKLRPDVPKSVEGVISKAMLKNREERYQSVEEMLSDLKKAKGGERTGTYPAIDRTRPKLVAVLPFEDLSPEQENEYFANGITDEIITDLSRVSGLRVTPRATVMSYKKAVRDLREVGKELQVEYLLHGSVKKFGEKIRITVQLTSVADGFQLWGDKYNGEMKDIFDIQDKVSKQIVAALKLKISPQELEELVKRPTESSEAYDFYLKGRDYYYQEGKASIDFAVRMYEKALDIDSDFALAYAGLGDAYVTKYMTYFDKSTAWLDEAERNCKKALKFEANLPEAHRALGRVYHFKKKYAEAETELKKAVQVKSDYTDAHRALAWLYLELGRQQDAIYTGKKALETRPLDKETYLLLGLAYQDQNQDQKALEMFDKALDIAPDYFRAYYQKGQIFQRRGDFKTAIENYRKTAEFGLEPNLYVDLGWAYLVESQIDQAIESFKKSAEMGLFDYRAYYFLGLAYEKRSEKWMAAASYDSSVVLCRQQISKDPEDPLLFVTLSLALAALRKYPEAKEAVQKAIRLDQSNGNILYDIARVYAMGKDYLESIETLKKAFSHPLSPTPREAARDPHFEGLKDTAEFQALFPQ